MERSNKEVEREGEEGGKVGGFVFGGVGEEEAGMVLEYLEKFRGGRGESVCEG